MNEQLIKFETAKLAKEKGFSWKCLFYRQKSAVIGDETILEVMKAEDCFDWNDYGRQGVPFYSMPTQSLLQKWLREEHKIDLTVMIRFADSYSVIIHQNRNVIKEYTGDNVITRLLRKRNRTVENYSTKEIIVDPTPENIKRGIYEEALEKGLQEALKLI